MQQAFVPTMTLVGLPDAAIKESAERVRAAIKNSGLTMPGGRFTVNLAPADLRKAGPSYDLPIALGVLAAAEQVPVDTLRARSSWASWGWMELCGTFGM